jgi:hypothetical protein
MVVLAELAKILQVPLIELVKQIPLKTTMLKRKKYSPNERSFVSLLLNDLRI